MRQTKSLYRVSRNTGQNRLLWGGEDQMEAEPTSPTYLAPEFAIPEHGERNI